ncbi:MAG: hypothetical protein ACLSFS_04510 [Faecalibacillus intestinalis]|uniref:hypothetical protein n=2 Tax=Faecalibacillus intestinalis TaxID=1982626 RepID=UPI0039931526
MNMMEWIIAISVLLNFVLALTCIILKRSRDWHEKMWFKMANARNQERLKNYGKSQNRLVQHEGTGCKENQ